MDLVILKRMKLNVSIQTSGLFLALLPVSSRPYFRSFPGFTFALSLSLRHSMKISVELSVELPVVLPVGVFRNDILQ